MQSTQRPRRRSGRPDTRCRGSERPLRPGTGRRRRHARHRAGRGCGPARSSGCGKTTLQGHRGLCPPGRRPRTGRRRDHRPSAAQPAQHRHRLPELRPVPAHDGGGERALHGLRARGVHGPDVQAKVSRFLETVQLGAFARAPAAPARAASSSAWRWPGHWPSNLDPAARRTVRRPRPQPAARHADRGEAPAADQLGLTTILVTHDQDEAMSVADRIAVMNKASVEQFDTPVAIYDRPQTLFVNGFIGTHQPAERQVASLQNGTATVALDAGASLNLPAPPDPRRRRARAHVGTARAAGPVLSPSVPTPGRSSPALPCPSARSSFTPPPAPSTAHPSRSSSRVARS